ncbi:MAG: DUF2147 domain-containing protein [Deltaproteobacteria bacterium]
MKQLLISAAALLVSAGLACGDPLEGIWKTIADDNGDFGYVQIAPCRDRLCGELVKAFRNGKEIASANIGMLIVYDMQNLGHGNYGNGKVWSPDRNKDYKAKLVLSGNTLTVQGCVVFACRDGGTWTKVK